MVEFRRCELHGTVLTASGACLLCERRAGRTIPWLLVGVVGVVIVGAVGLRVHLALADRPADVSARPEPPAPAAAPAADDHEGRVAEAARAVQIDFYGAGWCPSCRKARAWLDAQGVPYTYRDTTDDANRRSMRALNPNGTIPTIDIEGNVVVGFNPGAMRASIRRAAEARVARNASGETR